MIRDARAEDAPAIAAIWNPVIRETAITFNSVEKNPEEIAALIAARQAEGLGFFVAEGAGGAIAGFATYFQFRAGVGYAHSMEHTVILAPEARGRGVGRSLMAHVEAHATARGAHCIFAGVSSGNPAGRAFHARLGYVEVAVLREVGFKFGLWFDLHLMQKFL
ncbi:phosphinothricin acetyltransferase [Meinhardsimonia xiamenensis]|jgi:phosphinothricin acetyltransferase|uniref:Phosphinothricin acetyltransferase n=1 Tax=Meinhardsimonia xiamenensis TaxID=990712 RepID=A0A1G9AUK8_9RHOB|nr:GNAT family N-acetyltransferase [Meinhardsimonia xiamenensis]PRX35239.1 phosphinothricin acetyltransferase [Meinhardsimonia xiamenensis]SDK31026.1 phosphinothricin acetyltransferase [Meinhardsimonia xiamenensis]